jgi:ankyrin repeat protein
MLAACNGHVDAVRTLLTLGSKVETSDADGWTALHEAVDESHVEVARLLLDEKADVNAITEDNFTPMLLAMMERCERMIQLLRSRGGRLIDLNTPDEEGRTHLLRAVMDERWDDVEALVRWAEAEINCPDNNGITPLMEATRLNAPEEVIELLSPQSFFSFFRWLDG